MQRIADDRYTDGEYLAANPTWGEEDSAWKAECIRELLSESGLPQPQSIAEIGCGAGGILAKLHDLLPDNVHFNGFDIAPAAIELAKRRASTRLNFHLEDLTKSNLTFDLLLCIDVFEHVEDPFAFLRALKKLAPVVVFNIPLEMHVAGVLINHQRWTRRHYGHLHFYTAAVAFETLEDCGYTVTKHQYISRLMDMPRTPSEYLFWLPRRLLSLVNKELSARILGGTSLLVVARSNDS